jgi:hypothetical protein
LSQKRIVFSSRFVGRRHVVEPEVGAASRAEDVELVAERELMPALPTVSLEARHACESGIAPSLRKHLADGSAFRQLPRAACAS